MQLCNERFRIRCFPTKNDPEWHALCSRRIDCSVPLRGCFNNQLQLIAERGPNKSSVVFLVASLIFRSEALSSGYFIASFQLGSSFGFWAKDTLGYDPFSRVGACGRRPSESADPGCRRVGSFTGAGIGCTIERKLYGGRGLGLVRCSHESILVFKIGGFITGK